MNIDSFLCFVVLLTAAACVAETTKEFVEETHGGTGGQSSYFFPTSGSSTGQEEGTKEKKWKCGFEQIVVPGPDGKMIIEEIPLECDPLADIYTGCPAPMSEQ